MKRKFADRPDWTRIIDKTYLNMFVDENNFKGQITYLVADNVSETLWASFCDHHLCIVDKGYVWLQQFPEEGHHVLTATYDQNGVLVYCYFDIVKSVGTTDKGIPYYDDLYIDVVAFPNGEIYVLDENELEEAYRNKEINKEEFELARKEVSSLITSIKEGTNVQLNATLKYYEVMKGKLTRR